MRILKRAKKGAVRNATKVMDNGIKFDSKLEHYCYTLLKQNKINFELKKEIISVPSFRYLGKSYLPVKHYPDFWLPQLNLLIDTKGFAVPTYALKSKLMKKYFHDNDMQIEILLPSNRAEVEDMIKNLNNNIIGFNSIKKNKGKKKT